MINVGVAGLGKMGKLHFLNALNNNEIKVKAVADVSRSKRKAAEKFRVKSYKDYREMIDAETLDAIIISLPNFLKMESVFYAADKDLSIFIDKPMARNYEEAKKIYDKVRSKNVRLMVGTNYRYFDSVEKLKKKVEDGNIGEAVLVTSELIMDGPFSHPLVPTPVAEWWFDKEKSGGGALLDLGYHLLDLYMWMFGDYEIKYSEIKHRYNLPIEDSATVILNSKHLETSCVVNVGWFSKMLFPAFNFRFNVHGTVGYTSTDNFSPKNLYLHAAKEGTKNFFRKITFRKINYLSYTYYHQSFVKILNHFFDSIIKGYETPMNLNDQLSIIKSIDISYQKGMVNKIE